MQWLVPCLVTAESGFPFAVLGIRNVEENCCLFLSIVVSQHEQSEGSEETTMSSSSLVAIKVVIHGSIHGQVCYIRKSKHQLDVQLPNHHNTFFNNHHRATNEKCWPCSNLSSKSHTKPAVEVKLWLFRSGYLQVCMIFFTCPPVAPVTSTTAPGGSSKSCRLTWAPRRLLTSSTGVWIKLLVLIS